MSKLILGVATNSGGKYKSTIDGKRTNAYRAWYNMLRRVRCPKLHARQPTYIGCSVAEKWRDYQGFAEWFENHDYSHHGYELDKDLLLPGNKIYAPERCVFVPRQLNNLLNDHGNARGQYLQGVGFDKSRNKFVARMAINGKCKRLGRFDSELEAYQVYKTAKEANVKRMALEWRDDIADNVFEALMNWKLIG